MEYNEAFFKNSAQTGIIFIVKTSNADEAKRNREWLEANYVGSENAHRPLLLEGDVDVEKSVSSRQEMEYLEGRKLLREEILMVLDMDPDKVGLHEHSNRSTSKVSDTSFHAETVWPRQVIVEEELSNALLMNLYKWDNVLVHHLEGDIGRRSDEAEIWDRHQKMGRLSVNDILKSMGRPTLSDEEGGNVRFIMGPSGMIPLSMIEDFARAQLNKGKTVPLRGTGSTDFGGTNQPTGSQREPLTRNQADAVSQNEPR
jgi:phage portal protein BeeE